MTRPANQHKWKEGEYNPVDGGKARVGCGSDGPCRDPDCRWKGVVMGLLDVCYVAVDLASKVAAKNDMDDADIQTMQATISDITKDNKKLTRVNKELNAKKNGINTVPANDKVSTKKPGRPRGTPATKNYRPKKIDRQEVVDFDVCPKGHSDLSDVTDKYPKVVQHVIVTVENVEYIRVSVHNPIII